MSLIFKFGNDFTISSISIKQSYLLNENGTNKIYKKKNIKIKYWKNTD